MTTETERERIGRELAECRRAMNNPKIGLFAMRREIRRLGELLNQLAELEKPTDERTTDARLSA